MRYDRRSMIKLFFGGCAAYAIAPLLSAVPAIDIYKSTYPSWRGTVLSTIGSALTTEMLEEAWQAARAQSGITAPLYVSRVGYEYLIYSR